MATVPVAKGYLGMYSSCDQEKEESSIRLGYCTFYDSAEKEVTGALCMSLFPKCAINNGRGKLGKFQVFSGNVHGSDCGSAHCCVCVVNSS